MILKDRERLELEILTWELQLKKEKLKSGEGEMRSHGECVHGFEKRELKAYSSEIIRSFGDFSKWKFQKTLPVYLTSWSWCSFEDCRHII